MSSKRALAHTLQPFFFPSILLTALPRGNASSRRVWFERIFCLLLGAFIFAMISRIFVGTDSVTFTPRFSLTSTSPFSHTSHAPPYPSSSAGSVTNQLRTSDTSLVSVGSKIRQVSSTPAKPKNPSPSEARSTNDRRTESFGDGPRVKLESSSTGLQTRFHGFASFMVARVQQFYNKNVQFMMQSLQGRLLQVWQLYKRVWNWPVPLDN
jgi:hypothetical protein